jgi:hypothetical protein
VESTRGDHTGPMSFEKSAGDIGRESCRKPGAAHKARNCFTCMGAETGLCGYSQNEQPLLKPAQPIEVNPLLHRQVDTSMQYTPPVKTEFIDAVPQIVASVRALLPTDKQARKNIPVGTGVLDYFPAALAEVARCSKQGNDQHNPGQPLHWARGKSMDHFDAMVRHGMERGTIDDDGIRHSAKAAWRALAQLQQELEDAGEAPLSRASKVAE